MWTLKCELVFMISGLCVISACKTRVQDDSLVKYSGTYFTGTAYACSDVTPKPADNSIVAVPELNAKLSPSLKCIDQWAPLDWNSPPWEQDHWLAKIGRPAAEAVFKKFPQAFRSVGGVWQFNQPDCTTPMRSVGICGKKVSVTVQRYEHNGQTVTPKGPPAVATIFDACPGNHWNNAIKDDPRHPDNNGGQGNPCRIGSDAVDVHKDMWTALGVPIGANHVHFSVTPL